MGQPRHGCALQRGRAPLRRSKTKNLDTREWKWVTLRESKQKVGKVDGNDLSVVIINIINVSLVTRG